MDGGKDMYHYKIYGLTVASEVELEQAVSVTMESDPADVLICLGKTPETIDAPLKNEEQHLYMVSDREMLFHVEGVATFFIQNGCKITFTPAIERADHVISQSEAIQLFLLGTCFGALLIQRDIFPLHGSCVEKDGEGIVLIGDSGAGKSTIARAFINQGWRLVSDDVIAVTENDGQFFAEAGFPGQKLWEDALARLTTGDSRKILRTINDQSKFAVDLMVGDEFCGEPVSIVGIYLLLPHDCQTPQLRLLDDITATHVLLTYVFRRELVIGTKKQQRLFQYCVDLAGNSKYYEVMRPTVVGKETEVIKMILENNNLSGLKSNR